MIAARNSCASPPAERGARLHGHRAARAQLPRPVRLAPGHIDKDPLDPVPMNSGLSQQMQQRWLGLHVQRRIQLAHRITGSGSLDECMVRLQQRSVH